MHLAGSRWRTHRAPSRSASRSGSSNRSDHHHLSRIPCKAQPGATTTAVTDVKRATDSSAGPASPAGAAGAVQGAKIYVRTNWQQGWLHGSIAGGPWHDVPMQTVPSCPGKWLVADVKQGPFEFVATDRRDNWIKSTEGNFVIPGPGRYMVYSGAVHAVTGPAVMVVSDLDGTMVGDDGKTELFKKFWETAGAVRGGVLVYNTGRALNSFLQLLKDKRHCMAHPDALISAVGTKVYEYEGGKWREDEKWSATLDEGWKVEAVREAGYKALAQAGKEVMHFRPPDEQNEHKVTCGVNVKALDQVLASINTSLAESGVTANVITSGHGEWRYLDIVPIKAGKLEALEYVRKRYNFPVENTVACGDSGNDILMLAGKNPAIVVGNAQPDLLKWVDEQRQREAAGRLIVARKHEALGILEGLETLGLL